MSVPMYVLIAGLRPDEVLEVVAPGPLTNGPVDGATKSGADPDRPPPPPNMLQPLPDGLVCDADAVSVLEVVVPAPHVDDVCAGRSLACTGALAFGSGSPLSVSPASW